MSMSASLTVKNNTGSKIRFTSVDPVNDDPTFHGISQGEILEQGKEATLSMGNSSVFFDPKGVGCNLKFVCQQNFDMGNIFLDDPALGAHSFNFGNQNVFSYDQVNLGGNAYQVTIGLK